MPRIISVADPADLAEARGELVPAGRYWDVLIEDCKDGQSRAGEDKYTVRLLIRDEGDAHNRKLFGTVMQTYPARFSLVQLNKSLGLPVTALDDNGVEGLYVGDPQEYIGQVTAIDLKVDPSKDFPYNITYLEQSAAGGTLAPANGGTNKPAGGAVTPVKASGRVPLGRGRAGAAKPALASVPEQPEAPAES